MTSPLRDINAVVLAGGLGTRLRSVVSDRAKVVAEIHGRPFLHYLFDQLAAAGIRHIVLCTGYMAEKVRAQIGDYYGNIGLTYSAETEPLGTGGALRLARPLLSSDPVLVMNGDSFCDVDLLQFAKDHFENRAAASLALAKVSDISRFGAVDLNLDGAVSSFEEKGSRVGAGLINAGIYLLSREIIASIPDGTAVSLERDVFPGLIGNGLHGFVSCGKFIDIGVPADYHAAAKFFSNPDNSEDTP